MGPNLKGKDVEQSPILRRPTHWNYLIRIFKALLHKSSEIKANALVMNTKQGLLAKR